MKTALLPLLPYGRVDNVLFRAGIGFAPSELSVSQVTLELEKWASQQVECVVFPSHFFDHPDRMLFLTQALEMGLKVRLQISPGAELAEFYGELLKPEFLIVLKTEHLGLELVFDRPLLLGDLNRLAALGVQGWKVYFVYCPTYDFEACCTISALPEFIRNKLTLYFAPKVKSGDIFLSSDRLYLLLKELRDKLPDFRPRTLTYFREFEPATLFESALQTEFRWTLDESMYRREFCSMGRRPLWRALLETLVGFQPGRLFVAVGFYLVWILKSPSGACRDLLHRAYGLVVGISVQLYWLVYSVGWRTVGVLRSIQVAAYWRIRAVVVNPLWFIRTYLPPVYFVFIFPLLKTYWFVGFQVRTRLLRGKVG